MIHRIKEGDCYRVGLNITEDRGPVTLWIPLGGGRFLGIRLLNRSWPAARKRFWIWDPAKMRWHD